MVNGFEEEVKALEEYGHDCCARIDDRIHECCKRIREAHAVDVAGYQLALQWKEGQPPLATYDALGNERHKAVCELRNLSDSPSDIWVWKRQLGEAIGADNEMYSSINERLIHLLGGGVEPITLSDLYGIWKGDGGVDAGRRDETGGGRSDAAADGHMADSAGSQVSEGVAPATGELRNWWVHKFPVMDEVLHRDFMTIADRIDAVNACLERENAELREVNERQDEQYVDMVHRLDRAYEKNRNQRKQLTEVQEALHRRNEGELKTRWQKELDRLGHENEELRRQLESLMLDSRPMTDENMAEHGWYRALDADKKPIHLGDEVYQVKGGWVYTVESIKFYSDNTTVSFGCKHGFGCDSAHNVRHYYAPTVEDVLREFADEMNKNLGMYTGEAIDADEWRDVDAKTVEKFAAKLRLAEVEDA